MSRMRVLIADDHPVFRYGLRALLQTEATMIEVVGDAAILVHPGRPNELAQAILHLIESPRERDQLSQKALAWAVSHYSASRNALRIEKLYETIAQKT